MTSYWTRILLGALAIFAAGMAVLWVTRRGVDRVHSVVDTSDPLTIPTPFVPFKLDGERLGRINRVTFVRETPRRVTAVELAVELSDSATAARLEPCLLVVDDLRNIDERTTFRCGGPTDTASARVVAFGTVRVKGLDRAVPLFLPIDVVQAIRDLDSARVETAPHPPSPPDAVPQ